MTAEVKKQTLPLKPLLVVAGAVVLAVALGLAIKSAGGGRGEGPEKATFVVVCGPLDIVIKQTGELQTKNPTRITAEISGEATISELAEEGKRVKKGELLVKLDSSQQEEQLANQEIEVENSRAQLVQAQENKKIQELNNKTSIASAQLELTNAGRAREKYGDVALNEGGFLDEEIYSGAEAPESGEAYQAFRDAELEIDRAETELTRAKRDFADMDELEEKGFVTHNDYIDAELKVLEGERKLESAQLKHSLLRLYNYPSRVAELDAAVEKAEAKLEEAELSAAAQMIQKEAAITRYERVSEKQQEKLEELQEEVEKMTVMAPEDGLVLYGDESRPWERDRIQVGAQVRRGQVIITLPRVSEMMAVSKVLERDINKVAEKQKAAVRIPALQDMELSGEVTKVASVADSGRRWHSASETKTFEIQISLEKTHERMKPGMSCNVEIMVERIEEALYVPVNAVFKNEGKDVCHVVTGDGAESRPVKVGKSNDIYAEILEGLSPGEEVYLYSVSAELVPAGETEAGETEADEAKADETEADETDADETEADEAEADETDADETEADEAEADETEADEGEADETEADEAEADETDADETEADEAEAEEIEAAETKADETEADGTEADETEADGEEPAAVPAATEASEGQ
ncbi:MAG: efflux RND transporter periplasmic adaptor subunit [Planctomycetota bacterium]